MPNPKKPKQPKPIRIDIAMIEKIRAQSRVAAAQREQDRIQRRRLASERLKCNHSLSGEILSNCDSVPVEDLAARWKVSPAMLVEAAGNGLFDIVITESEGIRDYLYFNRSRWPHGEKTFAVPRVGTVHTLVSPPLRYSSMPRYYFPVEEITRIEQHGGWHSDGNVSASPKEVSVKEAAAHYDVSTKTIRNWIKSRKIESRKLPSGRAVVRLK